MENRHEHTHQQQPPAADQQPQRPRLHRHHWPHLLPRQKRPQQPGPIHLGPGPRHRRPGDRRMEPRHLALPDGAQRNGGTGRASPARRGRPSGQVLQPADQGRPSSRQALCRRMGRSRAGDPCVLACWRQGVDPLPRRPGPGWHRRCAIAGGIRPTTRAGHRRRPQGSRRRDRRPKPRGLHSRPAATPGHRPRRSK